MNKPAGSLPQFIVENPRLGDWFAFAAPGRLTLKIGKVEIGQDILTALRQIAAEELEPPLSMVDVLSGDTCLSPNEGPMVASLSIMMSAPPCAAAIEMRGRLFGAAATRLSEGNPGATQAPRRQRALLRVIGTAGVDHREPGHGA
jgi:nicotinate dehydrogenase subunit B